MDIQALSIFYTVDYRGCSLPRGYFCSVTPP